MSPIALAIVVTTVPLLLLGGVAPLRRRMTAASLVLVVAIGGGLAAEVLAVSDLWVLPIASGLGPDLLLLMLWAVLGAVVRAGGPLAIPGPPGLVAVLTGACLGEIPAAAILSAGARTRSGAARLALAAAGGGLIGRVGDPAMLLLGGREPSVLLPLAPLGLLLAFMAAPRREDLAQVTNGGMRRTLVVVAVALFACVPGWTLWAVLAGIAGGLVMVRNRLASVDLRHIGWMGIACVLGLIAIAGGVPEMAASGLEIIGEQLGDLGAPALTLAGAILAALTDGTAASIFGLGVLDRAMSLQIPGAWLGMTAGLAVGGLGPLLAAGALRAGLLRWAAQVVVAVVYIWGVSP